MRVPAKRCPTCGKPAARTPDNPWRPFCTERCRLIDLGEWIEGRYRLAEDPPAGDGSAGPETPTRH